MQRTTLRTSIESIEELPGFHSTTENPAGSPSYGRDDLSGLNTFEVQGIFDDSPDAVLTSAPRAIMEEIRSTESLKFGKEPANEELAQRYYRITALSQGETESSFTAIQGVALR